MDSNISTSDKNYPTSTVITTYLFFGGAIGGGVIGLILSMLLVLETIVEGGFPQKIVFNLVLVLFTIPGFAFLGFFVGLVPATLTGVLVARSKLYRNDSGLSQSVIIGALSTSMYAFLPIVFGVSIFSFKFFIFMAFAAFIGAVSSYLTGLSALPKCSLDSSNSTSAHQ